jgi:hypothetical protein
MEIGMITNEDEKSETPSSLLAQKIVSRLVAEGLLGKEYGSSVVIRLEDGKMQPSDWKLVFEKSLGMHKKS